MKRRREEEVERVKAVIRERELDLSVFLDDDYERLASNGFLTAQAFQAASKEILSIVLPGRVEIVELLHFAPTVQRAAVNEPKFLFGKLLTEDIPPAIRAAVDDYTRGSLGLRRNEAGVTMFKGVPSLLLHYENVPTVRLEEEVVRSDGRTVILAGPSGCGKTKSLYSYFSNCRGLYFTVTAQGNGGSRDVESFMSAICSYLSPGQFHRNQLFVRLHVLILLASRVAIHKLCQSLSEKEWFMFQATCRGLCKDGKDVAAGTYDVFQEFYRALASEIPTNMSDRDLEYNIRELMKYLHGCCPHVGVDEAQLLLKVFDKNYFLSASTHRPLSNSFFQTILDVTTESQSALLVCGTGYTRYLHPDLVVQSVAKSMPPVNEYLWYGLWQSADEMIDFARTVLQLSPRDMEFIRDYVYERFRGRYRPFVTVVEQVLKGSTLQKAAAYVEDAVTKKYGKSDVYGSIYNVIEAIARIGKVRLLNLIERFTLQYYLFRRGITLGADSEVATELLEYGLAVVSPLKGSERCVEMMEYLVMRSADNFYTTETGRSFCSDVTLQMLRRTPYASAQAFHYQNYVLLKYEIMWDNYGGRMSEMPLFAPAFKALPQGADKDLVGDLEAGFIRVAVHSKSYGTREFLEDKGKSKRCTSLICEETVKGGAYTITKVACRGGMTIFHQCKCVQKPLTAGQFQRAVNRSCISDPALRGLCGNTLVCIVDIYPHSRPKGCDSFWWRYERGQMILMVVVDAENGQLLFQDDTSALKAFMRDPSVLEIPEEK